jgi:hypothetical protein
MRAEERVVRASGLAILAGSASAGQQVIGGAAPQHGKFVLSMDHRDL